MGVGVERWRVFVSHTRELREFPGESTYVAEVERAIAATGHVVVDMRDFPAADQAPADLCAERVRSCEVYVGLLGTRYGSPVRDRPEVSYTELEFDIATAAGLDRLVFLLDTDAENVGIPLAQVMDWQFGDRQAAFRDRVRNSGLTVQVFDSPAKLGQLVERSLRELADTRQRMVSGIVQEQLPAEPQPVRASKFINPPPAVAPTWFQDRQVETGLLARHVTNPGIRLVTVVGRGGVGKTAMVCRLLKMFEAGQAPEVSGRTSPITMSGIVYLSRNGAHRVEYPTLVADLARLLPDDAGRLLRLYQEQSPAEVMAAVLDAFPAGDPVVVLLDNLETVMDTTAETLRESALAEALTVLLTAPAHAVTVIATTRVAPTGLLAVEPGAQRQLRLDEGLGRDDAKTVLRELDGDGALGLRDAPDEVLDGLCGYARGLPRALEAVKAILDIDRTLSPPDLLDRTSNLPDDRVVEVLVGEAYKLLDQPARQVIQALAVFPSPVPTVGVDFLLRPFDPTTNAALILARLVRRQLVRFQDGHYHLHPVDRDYVRDQIPSGAPGDPTTVFTVAGLQALAADYYTQIRTPPESWRGLDDIQPQLAEFDLRCATGDYDTAASVLADIDFSYLRVWGHHRVVLDMHRRIDGHLTDRRLNANHLLNVGLAHESLGDYRQAIGLYTGALDIYRDTNNRDGEAAAMTSLGACHFSQGDYREAIGLYTGALHIYRDTGSREGETVALTSLGNCHFMLGEYRQAIDKHTEALDMSEATGNRDNMAAALTNLGISHAMLGEYRQAIDKHTEALDMSEATGNRDNMAAILTNLGMCHTSLGDYPQAIRLCNQTLAIAGETGNRYLKAMALDNLGRARLAADDTGQALSLFTQAEAIADVTGDMEPAVEARSGLARTHLQLDNSEAALTVSEAALQRPYPNEQPTLLLLKGIALLQLHRTADSIQAFQAARRAADALLELHDRNIAALYAKALALCGLAVATGDPDQAGNAADAFTRAQGVTTAAGVTTASLQLLDQIRRNDHAGLLTDLRAAQAP
jgi:tetratricopeptide (TPR) repeat protein